MSIQELCKNADTLDEIEYTKLLNDLCDNYYNKTPIVSDEVYDSLVDVFEKTFKKYSKVGAPVGSQLKRVLPKWMGSLNKITDRKSLELWKEKYKGPYVLSDKIDGISNLHNKNELSTRGNGKVGTDISHILPYLKLPKIGNVCVRSEIYMPKDKFNSKYKDEAANARNMTAGLLNRIHADPKILSDLEVLAYEYDDSIKPIKQSLQLDKLEEKGYNVVYNEIVDDPDLLTVEYLKELLIRRKEEANYEIDGIVITNDKGYKPIDGENPKHAVAFKMEGECVLTTVQEVQWNTSKHGLLKPRVRIDPVTLSGATITWCTGFNAKFIIDNLVGQGAVVEVTRSGDVIPYIKEVVEPAEKADMPSEDYEWTQKKYMVKEDELGEYCLPSKDDMSIETHGDEEYHVWYSDSAVDIRIKGENDEMKIKKLIAFFSKLEAKFVGESSLTKLYEAGYHNLSDIFKLKVSDIMKIDGFKSKGATRLFEAINSSITNVPLAKVAAASGVMGVGIGEKKFQLVVDKHPDILNMNISLSEMTDLIKRVGGFKTLAVHFASKLPDMRKFLQDHPEITLKHRVYEIEFETDSEDEGIEKENHPLKGKNIVFTGFRSKEAEEKIKDWGGKVTTSVSGKTNLLVVAKRYSSNSKEIKADQLGIEVITGEEFDKRYM